MTTIPPPQLDARPPRSNLLLYLLCLPSWTVVGYCVVVYSALKLAPSFGRALIHRPAVYIPTALVIMGPFCWFSAALKVFKRWRRDRNTDLRLWVVVGLSGVVMVVSWVVLAHFARVK